MIKSLRLAFVEELGFFGRGRRVQGLFREAVIYTGEKSQINIRIRIKPNTIKLEPKEKHINRRTRNELVGGGPKDTTTKHGRKRDTTTQRGCERDTTTQRGRARKRRTGRRETHPDSREKGREREGDLEKDGERRGRSGELLGDGAASADSGETLSTETKGESKRARGQESWVRKR